MTCKVFYFALHFSLFLFLFSVRPTQSIDSILEGIFYELLLQGNNGSLKNRILGEIIMRSEIEQEQERRGERARA